NRKPAGAEKHASEQTAAAHAAREIAAACIKSAKRNKEPVGRNVPVPAEDAAGTLPEIGNDNDISFVITGTGFQPCLPLTHLIGCSQIAVPVLPADFQTAEFVDQEEVDHAGDRVGAIHSRGAILEDVHVIDHRKRKQVNVHASAKSGDAQRTVGDAFAIDQNQSLLRQ